MSETIIREWYFWLYSVTVGFGMAFTYDALRLVRRLVKHGRVLVDLEDILYWTACFLVSFALLYYGNHGVIRFCAVLGAGIGMYVYHVTFGRFFVPFTYRILVISTKPVRTMLRFLKNVLTHVGNHLTMKLGEKSEKGERMHARRSGKRAAKQKETCFSSKKK